MSIIYFVKLRKLNKFESTLKLGHNPKMGRRDKHYYEFIKNNVHTKGERFNQV